ncbi:MAG: mechanosensitive ion channel family protein [Sumerlaeia bacterium]
MAIYEYLKEHQYLGATVQSLLFILTIWLVRWITLRRVQKKEGLSQEDRRRFVVNIRNSSLLLMLVGLGIIWAEGLRTIAVSFVVVAGAIVIATKELIMCISGAVLRNISDSFQVGDRIEVGTTRGDVVDRTFLTTTILEIGPGATSHQHTGRSITLPNSLFLTQAVVNETYTEDYVLHSFSVPIKIDEDWQRAERLLLQAAKEECSSYFETARNHLRRASLEFGLEPPNADPRVSLITPEPGRINLLVRMPVPARAKGRIEQAIMRRFLYAFHAPKPAAVIPAAEEKKTAPAESPPPNSIL